MVTGFRSEQIRDGEVKRADLNTTTTGSAVITKIIAGTNISITSTGVDAGTGDVTIDATGGTASLTQITSQTVSGASVGDPVYWNNSNSRWEQATSATVKPSGIYVGSSIVVLSGYATGLSGLTAGNFYYMGNSGGLTTTVTGTKVGQAKSTTELIVNLEANTGIIASDITSGTLDTARLASASIALTKLETQADQTFLGNVSGGAASPIALTTTQVKTSLKYYDVELLAFLGMGD